MEIRIIVAAHKPYWMPEDPIYLPVQVGAAGKESIGYRRDDEGENISSRNANYCELTGLYWAWKHVDADYIGLAHYRRHFAGGKRTGDKKERVIGGAELEGKLKGMDILLPNPRNYRIETGFSQYVHAHHAADLAMTRRILSEKYPEYLPMWDKCMKVTTGHRFNMFVMKKNLFDTYCTWLFDVLFELEKRLDISSYSANDQRVFGFVSERLLDVWLEENKVKYRDIPYIFLDKENWITKILNFILRKIKKKEPV